MWSYLNLNLVGADATEIFQNVDMLGGAEAWRRIVAAIVTQSGPKRTALRNLAWNPKSIGKLTDFLGCLESWETNHRMFVEHGGEAMSEASKMDTIIQILPSEMTQLAMMKVHEYNSYAKLNTFLKDNIR